LATNEERLNWNYKNNDRAKRPRKMYNFDEALLGSISPTFYAQLLRMQVGRAAFLCLRFRFLLYWHKTVGAKRFEHFILFNKKKKFWHQCTLEVPKFILPNFNIFLIGD
jgi:hypothetical protein